MDRALPRVMILTGARGFDIKEIHKTLRIREMQTQDGSPAIILRVPNIKTQRGDLVETWIEGEAYSDLKNWWDRRLNIYSDSPYLFITINGAPVSAEYLSNRFACWSSAAGYAYRFFSSHSGRMAFGCRLAAEVLSRGGTDADIYQWASSTGLWANGSNAVKRYCDTNVRRFFNDPLSNVNWIESPDVHIRRLPPLDAEKKRMT